MRTVGIIAEYNPFHNGHKFHLEKTKELLNNDYTICIMSGNFIQRGLPAIYNKWIRTEMAIKNGVDLVIELPTYYAVNSADFFSKYSIKLLNSLGCIDNISFGAEDNSIEDISNVSEILVKQPSQYTAELKKQLSTGITFAKANEIAIVKILKEEKYSKILNNPNSILAIEYIKSLKNTNSSIKPFSINRIGDYNDTNISSHICSATAIRNSLEKKDEIDIKSVVPKETYNLLKTNHPLFLKDFGTQIIYSLRKMNIDEIANILEVSEGLESRLKKYSFQTNNICELISLVKTKRFTQAKIQRILIHVLLNMTKSEFNEIEKNNWEYIRVLGFNSKGKDLLKQLSKKCNIPVITSVKKFIEQHGLNPLLEKDILSSNIYCEKYNIDISQKLIEEK